MKGHPEIAPLGRRRSLLKRQATKLGRFLAREGNIESLLALNRANERSKDNQGPQTMPTETEDAPQRCSVGSSTRVEFKGGTHTSIHQ